MLERAERRGFFRDEKMLMFDETSGGSRARLEDAFLIAPARGWVKAGIFFVGVANYCLARAVRRGARERARFHREVAKCIREDSLTG